MTRDEQDQLKKDTLWEIHLADREIACLDRKMASIFEAMREVMDAADKGSLGAAGDNLVWRKEGKTPEQLRGFPASADLVETVDRLERARDRRDELQRSFDRM